MKNKLFMYFIVGAIFICGTALLHGMVKAEREAKAAPFTYTETSEVKKWQQDLMNDDRFSHTEDSIDWTTFDTTGDISLNFTTTEPNLIWAITDWGDIDLQLDLVQYYDIVFCLDNVEVKFKMTEGTFDVIYDPNNCTAAANTFFVCMKPHLQGMILEKAKELAGTK